MKIGAKPVTSNTHPQVGAYKLYVRSLLQYNQF